MIQNFSKSLAMVLVHEGGYVNHPDDPGGPTNRGITQRTLSAHYGYEATAQDVLNVSAETVATIYRRNYWDAARCNLLPDGLDYAVFDFAVNSGVSRAVRTLQTVLGVKADGVIGDITIAAIRQNVGPDLLDLILAYCKARMIFLRGLRTWRTFGTGWTRRVMGLQIDMQTYDDGVIDRAGAMATDGSPSLPRIMSDGASAKADEGDKAVTATVKEAAREPAVLATVGTVVTSALTAANGDGPLAYAVAAVLVIVAVAGVIIIVRGRKS
jgi:lysozyme family protein